MQILPTSQAQLVLKWKMGKERHPYKVPLKNVTAKQDWVAADKRLPVQKR